MADRDYGLLIEGRVQDAIREGARKLDLSPEAGRELNIAELPKSILEIANLESLSVARLGLRALPGWFADLSTLTTLNISGNRLGHLPRWLARLQNLTELNAAQIRIDWTSKVHFPPDLRTLSLSANPVKKIPDSVLALRDLSSLVMTDCGLVELPAALFLLSNLESLVLSSNRIARIPDSIGEATALVHFDVHSNGLKDVPAELRHCQSSSD